jgi:hypothetical protein
VPGLFFVPWALTPVLPLQRRGSVIGGPVAVCFAGKDDLQALSPSALIASAVHDDVRSLGSWSGICVPNFRCVDEPECR